MFSDYDWFLNYVENLEKVTPEKLLAAAREYLIPQRRVIGIYRPQEAQS